MPPRPHSRSAAFSPHHLCSVALLLVASTALARSDPSPITTELAAQKCVVVTAADGTRTERLESLASVVPGDAIRYTITFSNTGAEPASGIVVSLPLPREIALVEPIEPTPDHAVAYSVDGGTQFGTLAALTVTDVDGRSRPAALADVTHVRWTINAALAPGVSESVDCRATLK